MNDRHKPTKATPTPSVTRKTPHTQIFPARARASQGPYLCYCGPLVLARPSFIHPRFSRRRNGTSPQSHGVCCRKKATTLPPSRKQTAGKGQHERSGGIACVVCKQPFEQNHRASGRRNRGPVPSCVSSTHSTRWPPPHAGARLPLRKTGPASPVLTPQSCGAWPAWPGAWAPPGDASLDPERGNRSHRKFISRCIRTAAERNCPRLRGGY